MKATGTQFRNRVSSEAVPIDNPTLEDSGFNTILYDKLEQLLSFRGSKNKTKFTVNFLRNTSFLQVHLGIPLLRSFEKYKEK